MSDKNSARKGTLGRAQSVGPTLLSASQAVSPRLSTSSAVPPLPAVSEIDDQFEKLLVRSAGFFFFFSSRFFFLLLTSPFFLARSSARPMSVHHGLKLKRIP
jgi:hypothetical protein